MFNYNSYICNITYVAHSYSIKFSFACFVTWGFSPTHVHNSIYLSIKYADPLDICVYVHPVYAQDVYLNPIYV